MKKLIVWDLFGGGVNSVYKAIGDNPNFEIYTFDLFPERFHNKQYVVDLSEDFEWLKRYFSAFPKPDIIVASPLCQSFSSILSLKGGGTCFWKYKDETRTALTERSIEEFESLKNGFTKYLDANKQLFIKRLGKKCIDNTINLIKEFKPLFWYIENPKSSLIWKYIQYNRKDFYDESFAFNETYYGDYGYLQPKPTVFLSNVLFNLKNNNSLKTVKNGKRKQIYRNNELIAEMSITDRMLPSLRNHKYKAAGNFQAKEAANVSAIPSELLKDIFRDFWYIFGDMECEELSNEEN